MHPFHFFCLPAFQVPGSRTSPSPHTRHKRVCFSSTSRLHRWACWEKPFPPPRSSPRPELGGPCRTTPAGALPHLTDRGMPIPPNRSFLSGSSKNITLTILSFCSQEKDSYEDEGDKEETPQDNTENEKCRVSGLPVLHAHWHRRFWKQEPQFRWKKRRTWAPSTPFLASPP